ncbi:glycine betaine ABC transporter substrate-binding protein [Methanoculleus thermophilus]|jgi:glycine betaine/proline transport system substrate-binding protein|uniref:Glycine betaine/proline transport system substrate-binding protein n=3 Tax=Methanoculleus thermophilus TaxID=2200 RepID=A0A1G8YLN8_9EURY|nr:glycine betaine ABC transporter substrate-binding protein [Methanoculleus thermophilus]NLN08014.1 glycine betaine ABC transporter substrate-binding protein [Methanoculleus thermophilus]SDK02990.1 glycine betaine/proline transport system substrate-binding protein [Methanoculleus thermophilus]HQD25989.1 glycine betaine ABC transporter substrate-binding protein [Methanoculleus thermophilus]
MNRKTGNLLALTGIVLVLCLFSAGCTGTQATEPKKEIRIGYVTWDCAIASSNVMKLVFEEAGYDVELIAVDAGPLFQALASGSVDFTTTGWLPHTHEHYWEQYGDRIDYVKENIPGAARIGLVVPTYVTIDSIEEMNGVADQFGGRIVGIEPGAGIMTRTEQAIDEYGLNYELVASSSAGMAAELSSSIEREKWVVVTGWSPHWKFGRYDLKFLDDPKGVYGGAEDIVTLARQGLATDDPEAYAILTRFEWTGEDIATVMTDIADGMSEEEAAQKWIDANRDKVDAWLGYA